MTSKYLIFANLCLNYRKNFSVKIVKVSASEALFTSTYYFILLILNNDILIRLKKMICIGTNGVGERCKQYRVIPSNYCKRHDPEIISVHSSDNEKDNSDLNFTLSDLDNLSDNSSELSKIEFVIPEHQNLGIMNVKGDGYCFWRALSVCLYGNQNSYFELSEKCINEKSDDEIVSSKWVEFHEIPIISKILKITINIVHYMEEEIYLFVCLPSGEIENKLYPCEMNPSDTEAYIYYIPGHYTSIVRI